MTVITNSEIAIKYKELLSKSLWKQRQKILSFKNIYQIETEKKQSFFSELFKYFVRYFLRLFGKRTKEAKTEFPFSMLPLYASQSKAFHICSNFAIFEKQKGTYDSVRTEYLKIVWLVKEELLPMDIVQCTSENKQSIIYKNLKVSFMQTGSNQLNGPELQFLQLFRDCFWAISSGCLGIWNHLEDTFARFEQENQLKYQKNR